MNQLLSFSLMVFCFLFSIQIDAQELIKKVSIEGNEVNLETQNRQAQNYLVEIGGPDAYYWKQEIEKTNEIRLSNQQANGESFPDGNYTMQVTPIFVLSAEQRSKLEDLNRAKKTEELAKYRTAQNLPEVVDQFVVHFTIKNGKFVSSDNKEGNLKSPSLYSSWNTNYPDLYASVNTMVSTYSPNLATDDSKYYADDQVFADDVIVQSSLCVGFDCANGENFGSDTQRLKENNLRIHFDDTSNSASFPSNDWRLTANDSTNGGANYFAIEDATAGNTPFRVMAGAGNNAIYVSNNGGNVGMGTASPVVELHVTDGDSPTMRLEQNGANGWTPQTWDVAGNETNFFVRDVTNGSKLPFKIKPGAPDNALFVAADGNIGLGTANPEEAFHLKSGDAYFESGNVGIGTEPTAKLDVLGNMKVNGTSEFRGDASFIGKVDGYLGSATASFYNSFFTPFFYIDGANSRVGIGTVPSHDLHLSSNDAYKMTAGDWLGASDRRLKKDIVDFNDGLDQVMKIRPVKFRYNGKLNMPTEEEHIGIIAQEMQEVAPYTIKPLNDRSEEGQRENYLAYDGTAVMYLLVNAVQEQQEMIESQESEISALKAQLGEMNALKAEVAALAELLNPENKETNSNNSIGEK